MLVLLGSAAGAEAQGLPSEPITVGGGRVVFGGEVTATAGPDDPGFFNYTDYEYNALRNLRLAVTAEVRAHERVRLLGEIHVDRGEPFDAYGVYARIRPWLSRRIDVQVGRIPPTFGAFGRGGYRSGNLMIGYPLAYQYLTSIRSDALPASVDDLLRMRGRGWRSSFPLGSQTPGPGLPIVNGFHWDTGVQVHGVSGAVEWTAALTTGSLSDPRVTENNDGRQLAGRVVLHASPGLAVGLSAARGAFLDRAVQDVLPATDSIEHGTQRAFGADAEYSIGRFISRGEIIWSRWTLPAPFDGGALTATAVRAEARYRLWPGIHVAGRAEHLGFNTVSSPTRRQAWDAPVTRIELGTGWTVQRNVMLKASWQRNLRDAGRVRHDTLVAGQLVYWF